MDFANSPVQSGPHTPKLVRFSGNSRDFFGIWIVNLLLSIATLGIYSAWATVRTKQYFYNNTSIDGHRFEYLATPIQILTGRVIAALLLVAYMFCIHYFPIVGAALAISLTFLAPWFINQSFKFNMRMTRFRNIRFSFNGSYGGAFKVFVLLPILSVFTLYLLMPWVLKKIDEYLCNNIQFGDKPFATTLSTSTYFSAAVTTLLCSLVAIPLVLGGVFAVGGTLAGSSQVLFILIPAYFACIYLLKAIYQAMIRNHIFNSTSIDQVAELHSDLSPAKFAVVEVTNILAIAATLGFAYPWAKVRKAKILASASALTMLAGADNVFDTLDNAESSLGDEAATLFDIDVSLT
ncbi:YjgN family protein [Pseudoalteromonas luteoviolacea]|uniref:Putative membrane protein n=1 Tax=Pseudoalteromonas luteoviolacea (strain 2ta16) TaxID=1353533 RepID=V4HWU9_PSEL2|nr:YjgN family protein [Pseudoalteromonas luteoviolacea]ESP92419.1 putative membrane protein [Pseudoalteromonas luteoviolacea 2ta16]KZN34979.1 hypothetical protein N483_23850 [Pseudoalteromonas luteoviolacea NCIMB 1944]